MVYARDRKKILVTETERLDHELLRRHAGKLVGVLIGLGPTFIKFGQVLSTRPDVFPQEYIEELSKLQDQVPAAPFEEVESTFIEDFGPVNKIFDSFDRNAISGASLGQVYRAVLDGRSVAVKVNRPRIRETVRLDLKVIRRFFPLAKYYFDEPLYDSLHAIIDEFSAVIFDEMDYHIEAENLLRIRDNLRANKRVFIPNVYTKYISRRILTMEYAPGIKITDLDGIRKAGFDPSILAVKVDKVFLKMLLTNDIFHADPHPGNIAVRDDGALILYDFGMVGSLDDRTRKRLIRLYLAMAERNPGRVISMLIKLGTLQPNANREVMARAIELAIRGYEGKKVEELEVKELLEVANRTIYQFPFRLPRYLVLYMRMSAILEGICRTLDPKFNFIKILSSILEEEGLKREAQVDEVKDFLERVGKALEASIEVTPMLRSFLEYSYQNGLMLRKPDKNLSLIGGIITASAIVASAILFLQNQTYGGIGFAVALFSFLVTIILRRK